MKRHLLYGVASGVAGGAGLAMVLLLLGEGPIGQAVELERRSGAVHGPDMFSRGTQQLGGVLAALVYGAALGAIFAVAFLALRRKLDATDDWRASIRLAAIGLVTVFVVPFLKYPPNPPAVGSPDTIGRRTALYVVTLAWSLVATWATWLLGRTLGRRRWADHLRISAVAACYVAMIGAAYLALPGSPDAVTIPATLAWHFRVASLAGATAFWALTGSVFGALCMNLSRKTTRLSPNSAIIGDRAVDPV
jgi:predicted cobalt transporter CbtA